jgi:hypothetical protein
MLAEANSAVRITHTFGEPKNVTYELECSGLPLAIRVSGPIGEPASSWQLEVSAPGVVVSTSAGSRALAFALLVERWSGSALSTAYRDLDWQAIGAAMAAVRAL